METALRISGYGFPAFSAYNCIQTLVPMQLGKFYRSLSGKLHFIGPKKIIKYRSVIEGNGKIPLAFQELQAGKVVKVSSLQKIWQVFPEIIQEERGGVSIPLIRPAVPGTIKAYTEGEEILPVLEYNEKRVICEKPRDISKSFLFYAPELWMYLIESTNTCQEWGLSNDWRLIFEEV